MQATEDETMQFKECSSCFENFTGSKVFQAPCSHTFCKICISSLAHAFKSDMSLYPPRCCGQAIPIIANNFFPQTLVDLVENRKLSHRGSNGKMLIDDEADQDLFCLAEKYGWSRCSMCGWVIERNEGCCHLSCLCGHEFCDICGKVWRTCDCDEHEAMDAEEEEDEEVLMDLFDLFDIFDLLAMAQPVYVAIGPED
ncbi:hypothetical protein FGRMN_2308 [Fusarium graminum]|nr:hypothetical protein FGRMN_2308 [Fusarium graminum]